MQQGQYILDRWMVGLIRDICAEMGAELTSYSDDWTLELAKDAKKARVFGYKFDLNDAAATAIAGDKVATYQLLQAHGVAAVEHRLIRTKASQSKGWGKGLNRVVIKPLDGTSGHGIGLLASPAEIPNYIEAHPHIAAWAVAPYEEIKSERRFILLDKQIICQYEKVPVRVKGLWMHNLGLGATAQHTEPSAAEIDIATKALDALGLRLAAVDVILAPNGYKVLEVNDGIMMENYMRQSESNKAEAKTVYRSIVKKSLEA